MITPKFSRLSSELSLTIDCLPRHSLRMLNSQYIILTPRSSIILNPIPITSRLEPLRQRLLKLPEEVHRNLRTGTFQHSLPRRHGLRLRAISRTIFLEYDRFPRISPSLVVLSDIGISPIIGLGELPGIHVEGSEINCRYGEVLDKVDTVVALVRVGIGAFGSGIWTRKPAFVSE